LEIEEEGHTGLAFDDVFADILAGDVWGKGVLVW
jgi:hypothetical protein